MPRHTFSSCGHKGFGAYCHRCKEADRMDAIADGKATPKKPTSFKGREKGWFRDEARRLRTLTGKLSDALPKPSSDT